jgi:hypothetical protein
MGIVAGTEVVTAFAASSSNGNKLGFPALPCGLSSPNAVALFRSVCVLAAGVHYWTFDAYRYGVVYAGRVAAFR